MPSPVPEAIQDPTTGQPAFVADAFTHIANAAATAVGGSGHFSDVLSGMSTQIEHLTGLANASSLPTEVFDVDPGTSVQHLDVIDAPPDTAVTQAVSLHDAVEEAHRAMEDAVRAQQDFDEINLHVISAAHLDDAGGAHDTGGEATATDGHAGSVSHSGGESAYDASHDASVDA